MDYVLEKVLLEGAVVKRAELGFQRDVQAAAIIHGKRDVEHMGGNKGTPGGAHGADRKARDRAGNIRLDPDYSVFKETTMTETRFPALGYCAIEMA